MKNNCFDRRSCFHFVHFDPPAGIDIIVLAEPGESRNTGSGAVKGDEREICSREKGVLGGVKAQIMIGCLLEKLRIF